MANTSLTLGPHWEKFIRREITSGRYASASEVVRAALRDLEERGKRLEALRAHLDDGLEQIKRGEYVEFDLQDTLRRGKARAKRRAKTAQ